MRIIAGEFKSRPIYSPPDDVPTRPIPDRVKESLFSILRGHCEGAAVFDGFAGSGAIGLEAVSRGAKECVFVERGRQAASVLKANIELLGCGDRARVFVGDALGPAALAECPDPVHLVFLDPPYDLLTDARTRHRVLTQLSRLVARLDPEGFAVLRTPWPLVEPVAGGPSDVPLAVEGAAGPETHAYRGTAVHLYQRAPGPG